jgi:hypothetical protein
MVAGFALVFVAGAAGVGINASFALLPLAGIPSAMALAVFVAGDRLAVLALSSVGALAYAAVGVGNYFRAEDFESMNPGAVEISGGETSVAFVLLTLATSAWSLAAAVLVRSWSRR